MTSGCLHTLDVRTLPNYNCDHHIRRNISLNIAMQGMCEYTGDYNDEIKILKQYLVSHIICSCRKINNIPQKDHNYNTQPYLIGVNNHESASMTNYKTDFIDTTK
jgi:hypothetical protein